MNNLEPINRLQSTITTRQWCETDYLQHLDTPPFDACVYTWQVQVCSHLLHIGKVKIKKGRLVLVSVHNWAWMLTRSSKCSWDQTSHDQSQESKGHRFLLFFSKGDIRRRQWLCTETWKPLTNPHEQHQVVIQQFNEIGLQPWREINPCCQTDLPMMQHQ